MLGILTGLCVAIGFIFLGKIIFAALGITVADFQVAGGLILLCLAVRELVGFGTGDRGGGDEFGVVPLGMPLIAGPALLTALLILIDSVGILFTLLALLINLGLVALRALQCRTVYALDGKAGSARRFQIDRAAVGAIAISLIRRGWQAA